MSTNLSKKDLQAEWEGRLAQQYKQSTNLRGMVRVAVEEFEDIQTVLLDVLDKWNLDDATGVALDVIGEIVGYRRPTIDGAAISYFGYTNTTNYPAPTNAELGFGSLTNPAAGGRYRSITQPTVGQILLSDPEYRRMLRAKILRNATSARPEDVIAIIKASFDLIEPITLQEQGAAGVTITFGRFLSTVETQLLLINSSSGRSDDRMIPLPIAVSATYVEAPPQPFGWVDETTPDPTIFGFGDLSQSPGASRGKYASITV